MKTRYSIFIICLLTTLASGCKKDNNGLIRIYAEQMRGDNKILIDPSNPDNATWVVGETISIGGVNYAIEQDDDGFYLEDVTTSGTAAIYPGCGNEYNDIEVTGNKVVIKRLTVNFDYANSFVNGNVVDVVFPMAAAVSTNDNQLMFNHLTAGLAITLSNSDYNSVEVASLKIIAQGTSNTTNLSANGVTARWAVQGPTLPHDNIIGHADDDYYTAYTCEMNIDFITTDYTWMEQDEDWVEVPTHYPGLTLSPYNYNEPKTFYIPITISSLRYLTVIGYSSTGSQLFNVTKDLGSARTIEPNHMYTIPTIEF